VKFILDPVNFERSVRLPRFEYVPPAMRNRERIRNALYGLWEHNARESRCIVHGDLHLGNCYFEVDGKPGFLDWQGDTRGCWAHDYTEFVLTALEVEARRVHERPLLEFYLEHLASHGAAAPTFNDAWLQYRRNTIWPAYSSAVCPVEMQPENVLTAYTRRGMAAATDLDALASFDG
jgi:aminoglycoside phosphotransferase (APT) family kinase protein